MPLWCRPSSYQIGRRPMTEAHITVYARFKIGGDVHAEETEPLANNEELEAELEAKIHGTAGLAWRDVSFHPAGYVVGVDMNVSDDRIGLDEAQTLADMAQETLAEHFGEDVSLAGARNEPPVEIISRA